MTSFVKTIRSDEASFLDANPNANHMLNVIARRARRTKCDLNKLEVGECFISFKSLGLTEQQYRTAKKHLQKMNLVGFRVGRKLTGGVTAGVTVARLLDSRVYDINSGEDNATPTPRQRQPNANLTSNKECKNDKNDKNKNISQLIADEWNDFFAGELSEVKKLTQKRKSAINASIKEMKSTEHDFENIETWKGLFNYCSKSDFLMGRSGSWSMDFDFVINKNNLLKIIEGKYENSINAA